ncbi:glycosyltransferase family 2 protein [Flavobacterium adhaerens]|uniref:glycosyltransferase family 2 protein n=1 Tax=Flavobacterium adhaerens TaxID=3149043 RepID=UPI0032B3E926
MNIGPLVSICIPTYNGELYIEEALNSILNQTYSNFEIIISDDNSTDGTLIKINNFIHHSSIPVTLYHHIPNGIGANWNNCINNSKGKYIKFLFQDDILFPTCIEKMVYLAEQDQNIGLVYCKRSILYDPTNSFHLKWLSGYKNVHNHWFDIELKDSLILSGVKYLKDKNIMQTPRNKIGEPTAVLISVKCFDEVGYFNTELKQILDFEFWLRIMKKYNLGFIDEELVCFRLHSSQASAVNYERSISEKNFLMKEFYVNYFWNLDFKNKFRLLNKYVFVFSVLKRFFKE